MRKAYLRIRPSWAEPSQETARRKQGQDGRFTGTHWFNHPGKSQCFYLVQLIYCILCIPIGLLIQSLLSSVTHHNCPHSGQKVWATSGPPFSVSYTCPWDFHLMTTAACWILIFNTQPLLTYSHYHVIISSKNTSQIFHSTSQMTLRAFSPPTSPVFYGFSGGSTEKGRCRSVINNHPWHSIWEMRLSREKQCT